MAPEGWLSLAQRGSSAGLKAPRAPGFGHGPRPPGPRAGAPGLGPGTPRRGPGPRTPSPPSSAQQSPRGSAWRRLGQVGSGWLSLALPAWAARSTIGAAWAPHNWPCLAQFGSAWLNLAQRLRADIGARAGAAPSPGAAAQPVPARIRSARAARIVTGKASALTSKLGHCRAQLGSAWLSLAQRRCADRGTGGRQRAAYPAVWLNLVQHGLAWFSLLGLRVPP